METEGFPVLVPDKNSSSVKSLFLLAFPGILRKLIITKREVHVALDSQDNIY